MKPTPINIDRFQAARAADRDLKAIALTRTTLAKLGLDKKTKQDKLKIINAILDYGSLGSFKDSVLNKARITNKVKPNNQDAKCSAIHDSLARRQKATSASPRKVSFLPPTDMPSPEMCLAPCEGGTPPSDFSHRIKATISHGDFKHHTRQTGASPSSSGYPQTTLNSLYDMTTVMTTNTATSMTSVETSSPLTERNARASGPVSADQLDKKQKGHQVHDQGSAANSALDPQLHATGGYFPQHPLDDKFSMFDAALCRHIARKFDRKGPANKVGRNKLKHFR